MRIKAKYHFLVAWLLIMTLMPFFVVKATHFHKECHTSACQSEDGHAHSSCNQCPICHFALSPFTEAETFEIHIFLSVLAYEPVNYTDEDTLTRIYPYHLRAPPATSLIS